MGHSIRKMCVLVLFYFKNTAVLVGMAFTTYVNRNTSVVATQISYGTPSLYEVILNQESLIPNRVLYFKESSGGTQPRYYTISSFQCSIQNTSTLYLYSNNAVQLHLSTNNWQILGGFYPNGGWNTNPGGSPIPFPTSFSTQQLPGPASLIVNPTMTTSQLFVDLRAQSKTLVLPPISELTPTGSTAPFYTIKDIYGNAATNSLFISTSGGATLENPTVSNSVKINSNYAALDILPNATTNTWHILNYYNGGISTPGVFAYPLSSYYISSSVTYVDTTNNSKVIMLPTSSTVKDRLFYIKDMIGNARFSSIFISTQQNDLIDDTLSSLVLGYPYESLRVVSQSTTRYSITLDYLYGATPYLPNCNF